MDMLPTVPGHDLFSVSRYILLRIGSFPCQDHILGFIECAFFHFFDNIHQSVNGLVVRHGGNVHAIFLALAQPVCQHLMHLCDNPVFFLLLQAEFFPEFRIAHLVFHKTEHCIDHLLHIHCFFEI